MSRLGIQVLYVLAVIVLGFSLIITFKLLIFVVQAKRRRFSSAQIYLLLRYIIRYNLGVFRFFSRSRVIARLIVIFSSKELSDKERVLLERLYQAYAMLEQKKVTVVAGKRQPAFKSSEDLVIGLGLTLEFAEGRCRKNAKLISRNASSFLVRLFDEPEEYSQEVSVYFWSQEIGYRFSSRVLKKRGLHLELMHTQHIQQYLRRAHPRAKIEEPAYFFILSGENNSANYEIEHRAPGFECVVRDISEGGAAIIAEGRGQVGLHVKLQFRLGERELVMCGVIRDVYYDHEYNQSTLHMQADKDLPFRMKEPILSYVYALSMGSDEVD